MKKNPFILILFLILLSACNKTNAKSEPERNLWVTGKPMTEEAPTITVSNTPAELSPTVTKAPVSYLFTEEDRKADESSFFQQCNTTGYSDWPIIQDEKFYYYCFFSGEGGRNYLYKAKKDHEKNQNDEIDEIDDVDEIGKNESASPFQPEIETTGAEAIQYRDKLYYTKNEKAGEKVELHLYSLSMEDGAKEDAGIVAEGNEVMAVYELLVHMDQAAILYGISDGYGPGSKTRSVCVLYDLRTGEKTVLREETQPFTSSESVNKMVRLNAYHNVLFYTGKEGSKRMLFRYDLKNKKEIDCIPFPFYVDYAVLDEEHVVYSQGKKIISLHLDTGMKKEREVEFSQAFSGGSGYLSAKIGALYFYQGYIIVSEELICYERGKTTLIYYHVFDRELTKEVGTFQLPAVKQEWYQNVLNKNQTSSSFLGAAGDRIYFSGNMVFLQDNWTGDVSGYQFEDLLNGKVEPTLLYKTREKPREILDLSGMTE